MHAWKDDQMNYPITRLAWKHVYQFASENKEQQLYGSCLNGTMLHWTNEQPTKIEHIPLNTHNQYHTIDAAGDGQRVVVAGKLNQIEFWNIITGKMEQCWTKEEKHCHENIIFTARFFPFNSFNLYSGGWDRIIKFWDVRHGHQTMHCQFTQTCGDSLDMEVGGNLLVSGGGTHGEGI